MTAPAYRGRYILVVAAVVALGALSAAPAAAQERITISITNHGIVTDMDHPSGGLYVVTVKNETGDARGVIMKGRDLGVSPYVRFSRVLDPGESQSFRWYFPADRNVKLRDLMCCTHAERTCVIAGYGGMTTSLRFG